MSEYKKWAGISFGGKGVIMPYENAMRVFEALVECPEMYETKNDGWDSKTSQPIERLTNVTLYQFVSITPVPESYVAIMKVKGVE